MLFQKNNKKLKYVIIGAGSVGGTIAAFLKSQNKDVKIITKYKYLLNICKKQQGLRLISKIKGDKTYDIKMILNNRIFNTKADVIILCIRTPDFKSALPIIKKISHAKTVIIPIANGFAISETLENLLKQYDPKRKYKVFDVSFVNKSRWNHRNKLEYEQQSDYCDLKFSYKTENDKEEEFIKRIEKDFLEAGISGGYIKYDEMQSILMKRLITRSPYECCCSYYGITANDLKDEKKDLFKKLCNELLILAKSLNIYIEENFLDEYFKNIQEYKNNDDANIYPQILKDIKENKIPEIYNFLFIVEELAKKNNLYLPEYFKIAEKFKKYKNI